MIPERRALFLAAQHCQGGHSDAGSEISAVLGVPFPLRMEDLIRRLREEGENPAMVYPWLIKAAPICYGKWKGEHPYFTQSEIAQAIAERGAE